MALFIVDSSVFNKLYLKEDGREEALYFFERSAKKEATLLAPTLLYYEVISTAQFYHLPLETIEDLLEEQITSTLILIEPQVEHRSKALQIIQQGHPKSGFPSIYDAIFHALAIVEKGTLITADKKYYAKTKTLGHIKLLVP